MEIEAMMHASMPLKRLINIAYPLFSPPFASAFLSKQKEEDAYFFTRLIEGCSLSFERKAESMDGWLFLSSSE
jgi:hypothetical protein